MKDQSVKQLDRNEEEVHSNPLGREKTGKLLFQFSVPTIVSMLVSSLYNVVDQIFIGQGVGFLGNGATTVSFPLTTIGLAISLLLGVGASGLYSLQLGRGETDKASKTVGCSISFMLVVGIIYFILGELLLTTLLPIFGATADNYPYALEYSRIILMGMPFMILSNGLSNLCQADGSPAFSMVCMVAGALVNCVLDPLFIFVFGWGMTGAALATIIGQIISVVILLFYIPRFKNIKLHRDDYRMSWPVLAEVSRLGMAAPLNQASILIVQIVLNNLLKEYGAQSIYGPDIPIAASGVAFKLNGIFISVMVGLAQGARPIVGFNYGAEQFHRVKKVMIQAMVSVIVLGTMVELCFQIFPRELILLFGQGDELYIQFGVKMLQIYLACIYVIGVQALASNYFAAIAQPGKGVFLSLSRQIIFYIPLAFLLTYLYGIEGILFSQPIADVLSVLISVIMVFASFRQMDRMAKNSAARTEAA